MNRQEILEFINDVIEEEHGNRLTEDQLLIESELDSFGYAVLWTSAEYAIGVQFASEELNKVDHKTLSIKDMVDMFEGKLNENKKL